MDKYGLGMFCMLEVKTTVTLFGELEQISNVPFYIPKRIGVQNGQNKKVMKEFKTKLKKAVLR